MDFGLKGRVALVLGGTGGLGGAAAQALAGEGAHVAVAGRNAQAAADMAKALSAGGARAIAVTWDLGDLAAMEPSVTRVEAELGPIDILVNNTGGPPPTPAAGQSLELWTKSFEAMVASVIGLTDRVLPGMRERKWGRIITSTSSGVIAPIANLAISNALRLSLVGWSKTLSREVARDGVTVNVIVPGRIATARVASIDGQRAQREGRSPDEIAAESAAAIPIGRYGRPDEYGDVIAFLASERAAYMTGSVVRVDGGLIPSV